MRKPDLRSKPSQSVNPSLKYEIPPSACTATLHTYLARKQPLYILQYNSTGAMEHPLEPNFDKEKWYHEFESLKCSL